MPCGRDRVVGRGINVCIPYGREEKIVIKIMVLHDVIPCTLVEITNVSEEPATSTFRVDQLSYPEAGSS
jgi:hypothetical protein